MPTSIRMALASYAALLRLMPRSYRADFGAESMADLREILLEGERYAGQTVVGTALRASLDLMMQLPGTWWAELRPEPVGRGRGAATAPPGIWEMTMNFINELRLAARSLTKRPGFTLVAVVTLALGIGANVAIFSIVNGVLLRPLPFEDSDRLVEIHHHAPGLDLPELENSEALLGYYGRSAPFLEGIAGWGRGSSNLSGADQAIRVNIVAAQPELFDLLRVQPFMGRPFNADDISPDQENGSDVVALSWNTWRSDFGADPSILGRVIEIDGRSVEVVAVMPEGFGFPDDEVQLYRARYFDPDGDFGTFGISGLARLTPDVSVEAAQLRMNELVARIPDTFEGITPEFLETASFSASIETLRDGMVVDIESTLWILLGTVSFVLLIACANVANLFLVRAESRQKEMAVRAAMGAGRRAVAATFLSESLLLGIGGGVVGVLIAGAGLDSLLRLADLPRANEVSLDATSLAVAGLLSVVAGLAFGSLPMARYAGTRFAAVLRDGSRGSTTGRERHRARNLLVAGQLALALVLLVGSGLMLRSFAELRALDLGLDADGVLVVGLNRNRGEDRETSARFFQEAADRVATLPGVDRVGITTVTPLTSGSYNGGSFFIESKPRQEGELPPVALYRAVGASYFSSLGIPLVEGRDVERADWEETRDVVWVNEEFARRFLDGDAIGQRIAWSNGSAESDTEHGADTPWMEVVGVVGDVREMGLADEDLRPSAYVPLVAGGGTNVEIQTVSLTVRAMDGQDPLALAAGVEAAVREMAPDVPLTATRTMADIVSDAMQETSVTMIVLAVATAMALFLGAIGLAGVITYVVGQRTREIGVRVALGAQAGDVSRMILRQSMTVTAVGTTLGLLGAFGLTRLMQAVLFEVSATDPLTFVTAPVILVLVSFLATWVPVRRAARVDPMEALRAE